MIVRGEALPVKRQRELLALNRTISLFEASLRFHLFMLRSSMVRTMREGRLFMSFGAVIVASRPILGSRAWIASRTQTWLGRCGLPGADR